MKCCQCQTELSTSDTGSDGLCTVCRANKPHTCLPRTSDNVPVPMTQADKDYMLGEMRNDAEVKTRMLGLLSMILGELQEIAVCLKHPMLVGTVCGKCGHPEHKNACGPDSLPTITHPVGKWCCPACGSNDISDVTYIAADGKLASRHICRLCRMLVCQTATTCSKTDAPIYINIPKEN